MKISPLLINTPKTYCQKTFKGNEPDEIEYSEIKRFNPKFKTHLDPRINTLTKSAKTEADDVKMQANIAQKLAQGALDDTRFIKKQGEYYINHANELVEFYTNLVDLAQKQDMDELMLSDGKHFTFEKNEGELNIFVEKDGKEFMDVYFLDDGEIQIEYPNPDNPEESNIYIQRDGETYVQIGFQETGEEVFCIGELYEYDSDGKLSDFSRNVTTTPDGKKVYEEKYEFEDGRLSCFMSDYTEQDGCIMTPKVFYFDEAGNLDMTTSDTIIDSRGLTKIGSGINFSKDDTTTYISPSSSIIFENGKLSMYAKFKNYTGLEENPQVLYEIDFKKGRFDDRA